MEFGPATVSKSPEELFNENIGLAFHIAKRWRRNLGTRRELVWEDLKQEALFALWKAARTFDPSHGCTFSTWAWPVIENYLNGRVFSLRKRRCPRLRSNPTWEYARARPTAQLGVRHDCDVLLRRLHPRHREIIVELYGLKGDGAKTFEEVGRLFGISKQRVDQLAQKALEKMRASVGEVGPVSVAMDRPPIRRRQHNVPVETA
jgi:RNA polymerase sigma factor (sigma-70 family)